MSRPAGGPDGGLSPGAPGPADGVPRVAVPGFSGPLAELAAAMAAGRVDPASVPVAEVGRQVAEGLPAVDAAAPEERLEAISRALVLLARVVAAKARVVAPGGAGLLAAEEDAEEAGEDAGEVLPGGTGPPGGDADLDLEELAERVAGYRLFRQAAEELRRLEFLQGERFPGRAEVPGGVRPLLHPLRPEDLVAALAAVWERAPVVATVEREALTVAGRMEEMAALLAGTAGSLSFWELFPPGASRREVVVTFLALLELVRRRRARVWQEAAGGDIRVEACRPGDAGGGRGGVVGGGR